MKVAEIEAGAEYLVLANGEAPPRNQGVLADGEWEMRNGVRAIVREVPVLLPSRYRGGPLRAHGVRVELLEDTRRYAWSGWVPRGTDLTKIGRGTVSLDRDSFSRLLELARLGSEVAASVGS